MKQIVPLSEAKKPNIDEAKVKLYNSILNYYFGLDNCEKLSAYRISLKFKVPERKVARIVQRYRHLVEGINLNG